ncbi:hypothetical protein GOODEAATRI_004209, partial [Goodea atripinnis]
SNDDLLTWSATRSSDLFTERPARHISISFACPSIPTLQHPATHPVGFLLNCRPQSRDAMPSICQQGDCFSALEIVAWEINVAAGLTDPTGDLRW